MKKKTNDSILVIGDLHFKERLSYADYISDGRIKEKEEILNFITKSSADCGHIVLLGDCFDNKNPAANTVKEFVSFIESFGKKEVYIISGNHSKKGDGTTALDFLKEIKDKANWHIFSKPGRMEIAGLNVDFLPYMLFIELGVETSEEASKKIIKDLEGGDILFTHHSITGTAFNGIKTDDLKEIVLPRESLEKKYELVAAGHIHKPQQYGKILVAGNVFTTEVGETEKFVYKINKDLEIKKLKVPAREIHKLENPTPLQITKLPKDSIVKIIVTDKKVDLDELAVVAAGLDAYLIVEDYPDTRKKAHIEEGSFDFSTEALLKLYAEEKSVDLEKLLRGLNIING